MKLSSLTIRNLKSSDNPIHTTGLFSRLPKFRIKQEPQKDIFIKIMQEDNRKEDDYQLTFHIKLEELKIFPARMQEYIVFVF